MCGINGHLIVLVDYQIKDKSLMNGRRLSMKIYDLLRLILFRIRLLLIYHKQIIIFLN